MYLDAGLPVRAFFTTRDGGASSAPFDSFNLALHVGDEPEAVFTNRAAVANRARAQIAYMDQRHTADVAVVADAAGAPSADALVTATPGLGVAVLVADCVPVLLHDGRTGAVAAVHAGRAGVERGIVPAAVRTLMEMGARADSIAASIGPAICGRCYEVPADMRDLIAARHPSTRAQTSWGTPALDLPEGVRAQLSEAGIADITRVEMCTRERPDLFSHRRDAPTGRTAGVVVCDGS